MTAILQPETSEQACERIKEECGGYWSEHPAHSVKDWKSEIADDNTRQSYWQWVVSQMELFSEEEE